MLSRLVESLDRLAPFRQLLSHPDSAAHGLLQSARPYVAAGLHRFGSGAVVLLASRSELAREYAEQLASWLPPVEDGGPPIRLFAEPDSLPGERIHWSSNTRQQRLTALADLQARGDSVAPVVVASARALLQMTLPPRELRLALRPLSVGDFVRLEQLIQGWVENGYGPAETRGGTGRVRRGAAASWTCGRRTCPPPSASTCSATRWKACASSIRRHSARCSASSASRSGRAARRSANMVRLRYSGLASRARA